MAYLSPPSSPEMQQCTEMESETISMQVLRSKHYSFNTLKIKIIISLLTVEIYFIDNLL